jgi:hypothetical protein
MWDGNSSLRFLKFIQRPGATGRNSFPPQLIRSGDWCRATPKKLLYYAANAVLAGEYRGTNSNYICERIHLSAYPKRMIRPKTNC